MSFLQDVDAALNGQHPRLGRSVILVLYSLIIVSTLSIGIGTLPGLPRWGRVALALTEMVIVVVFTIEYALRIVIAPDRLAYVRSFWGIIDLVAILPFYLSLGIDLRAVRALRLLRLFRLFKLVRYANAIDRLDKAFRAVREELVIFSVIALFTLYLCAIGIYIFEHQRQPEQFSSVFESMWWAAVTLTTVGYGDVTPVTAGGRIFTVLVLFVALGVIAVPTGLMSSALSRLRENTETTE